LLVLLAELLAVSLTVAASGLRQFDWLDLGLRSFLIQWIVLLSAACLCPLRPWLAERAVWVAGLSSYAVVMVITLLCSILGSELLHIGAVSVWQLGENFLLASIFTGVVLRYLYVQQQWHNQQQAELRARIQALQSRIQPHFLFNSMNSIVSLIDYDPRAAERMVEDLSGLFRASLAEPGLVPLKDELQLCRQYLAIEQVRLGDRLVCHWQLDDITESDLENIKIPSLLLQPLLENAIHHGIQHRPDGGKVAILLRCEASRFYGEIRNPLALDEQASELPHNPHQGHQLALQNIHHRLQANFGHSAVFDAKEEAGQFVVRLNYDFKHEVNG